MEAVHAQPPISHTSQLAEWQPTDPAQRKAPISPPLLSAAFIPSPLKSILLHLSVEIIFGKGKGRGGQGRGRL